MTVSIAAPAQADGNLFFLIDGDTFTQPFSITNNSTAGESVLGFGFNLAGTGVVFDPVDGGPPGNGTLGTPFTPQGGTDVTTGLVNPVSVIDGSTFFSMNFTNFGVGETFSWLLDVDQADPFATPTVLGSDLIGALVYVDFSNGLRGSGLIQAVAGNDDAGQLVITTFTPTPGIPEPSTWAVMILGFGLAGAALRRRTSQFA
ncbi:MAG: hypothetical protein A2790_01845 [Phenylobacterium sp. RIFCSPHIGHO2_01_FULL_69_31]|nr:PEPxxWA-CTERM sorting domain-containing protein [Phenylobacterium sp.]OHB31284.1 MAG: hypothetical protein A2790_01845 [Phenylobacterium sp. RIFCSPHIGHO2_01_FULL_69_31]